MITSIETEFIKDLQEAFKERKLSTLPAAELTITTDSRGPLNVRLYLHFAEKTLSIERGINLRTYYYSRPPTRNLFIENTLDLLEQGLINRMFGKKA